MTKSYIRNAGILISAQSGLLLVFAAISTYGAILRGDVIASTAQSFSAGCLLVVTIAGIAAACMPNILMTEDEENR